MSPLLSLLGSLLIQMVVGALAGLYYLKVIKKPMFGQFWGAVVFGVLGGILGGFFLGSLEITQFLVKNSLNVDFVATLVGAFALLWLFSKIAH